jgi:hypothetical protein
MTAVAHKLVRIVYHLVTTQQEYDASVFEHLEKRNLDPKRARLQTHAKELGFLIVPLEFVP